MFKLIQAMLKTGGSAIIVIVFGAIATKIIAVFGGPSTLGIFSLLRQTQQTLTGIITMQGNVAIVQGLSYREDNDSKMKFLSSILVLYITLSLCLTLFMWVFASDLAMMIFDRSDVETVWSIKCLIPVVIAAAGLLYLNGILNGYREIGKLGLVQIASAASLAVLAFPLIFILNGLRAPLMLLLAMNVAGVIVAIIFIFRSRGIAINLSYWYVNWNWSDIREFCKIAGVTSLTALIGLGSTLIMRMLFAKHGGLNEAGIFDAALTLSFAYLLILLSSLSTYYLPVLTSLNQKTDRIQLIEKVLRVMLATGTPLVTIMILTKPLIISLLYSETFLACIPMVQWMLIGGFFKLISWVLAMPMLACADMKTFFWSELLANLFVIAGVLIGLFVFNQNWTVGFIYAVAYFIYLVYFIKYVEKRFNMTIPKLIFYKGLLGLCIVIFATIITWNRYYIDILLCVCFIPILIIYGYYSVTYEERIFILNFVKKLKRSKG